MPDNSNLVFNLLTMQAKSQVWIGRIGWPFFAIMGVLFAAFGTHAYVTHQQSLSWPTTEGTIAKCEVQTRQIYVRRQGFMTYHEVHVQYTFLANGRQYQGKNLVLSETFTTGNLRDAEAVANQYPVGATVPVHYAPHNPTLSALRIGPSRSTPFLFALAGGCLLMSPLMWFLLRDGRRRLEALATTGAPPRQTGTNRWRRSNSQTALSLS